MTFQDHMILARLPQWLAEDGFTAMSREMLGDTEASFFVPGVGLTREFVEYKNHEVDPAELRAETDRFHTLDQGAPGVYRRFVIGCTHASATLRPFIAALGRIRGALPFYGEVSAVAAASYADYAVAADKVGLDAVISRFIYDKVVLETNAPDAEKFGQVLFETALREHFVWAQNATGNGLKAIWRELVELLRKNKAVTITRQQIEAVLAKTSTEAKSQVVRVHTSHEPQNAVPIGAIPFRWEPFFGGAARALPESSRWEADVVGQLQQFRCWVGEAARPRRILLSGSRRLSVSLAIGSVFSAVAGFAIDEFYRTETWRTDDHADAATPEYAWRREFTLGSGPELAIGVGVIRDVEPEVVQFLEGSGMGTATRLILHGADAITSPQHLNRAIHSAKQFLKEAVDQVQPRLIHFFVAGPGPFALGLGHRLNAIGPMQCYERTGPGSYVPTCVIWSSQ